MGAAHLYDCRRPPANNSGQPGIASVPRPFGTQPPSCAKTGPVLQTLGYELPTGVLEVALIRSMIFCAVSPIIGVATSTGPPPGPDNSVELMSGTTFRNK